MEVDMRMTIKLKLGLAFGCVILLSALTAALAIASLSNINVASNEVLDGPVVRAQLATELYTDLIALSRAERSLILAPTEALASHYEDEIADSRKVLLNHRGRLEAIATSEGKVQLAAFDATWSK
jgi:methyl-accepting chemotaxis protein